MKSTGLICAAASLSLAKTEAAADNLVLTSDSGHRSFEASGNKFSHRHHRLLSSSRLLYSDEKNYDLSAGKEAFTMRSLRDDLEEICRGFEPTDDIFLKGSDCECEERQSEISVTCRKQICIEEENGDLLSGDFYFQAEADFGSEQALDDMQIEAVINQLFEGDYRTCFDYDGTGLYNGELICVQDTSIFGDNPTCDIFIGDEKCRSCSICENDLVTLTSFDCSNVDGMSGEKLDQCTGGGGLDGTVLRFLDLQAIPLDTDYCDGARSMYVVSSLLLGAALSMLSLAMLVH